MWLCNYTNDIGLETKWYKPKIKGYNLATGEILSIPKVISLAGKFIPVAGYFETTTDVSCPVIGRPRALSLQVDDIDLFLEYYAPFTNLNWGLEGKIEQIPERLSDADLIILLKEWV